MARISTAEKGKRSEDEERAQSDQPIRITIEGYTVTIDPDSVHTGVAGTVRWANMLGIAYRDLTMTDTRYRQFRARAMASMLEADPKASEWKCKVAIEASDEFLQHKAAIAECQRNVRLLQGIVAVLTGTDLTAGEPAEAPL